MSFSGRKPKILIADDDAGLLDLLEDVFTGQGFEVDLCENGSLADSHIKTVAYDAILSDINMPYLDGIELTKRIRLSDLNKCVKVFIISGFVDKEKIGELKRQGISQIFIKPFRPDEIAAKIAIDIGYSILCDLLG